MAGRALAGGIGARLGRVSQGRCGKGDCLCHWGGAAPSTSEGGIRKRTAFPPPARDAPIRTGATHETRGQRRPRRVRKRPPGGGAGAGRGHWPPAGLGVTGALWQRRWPLPLGRWTKAHFQHSSLWGAGGGGAGPAIGARTGRGEAVRVAQRRALQQHAIARNHRGMGAVACPQLATQRLDVQLDGDFLQVVVAGDFLVRLALADAAQHVHLAP